MTYRLLKGILEVTISISWLLGIIASIHLIFYPNLGGISISKDWTNIISGFCVGLVGLVSKYYLLDFFTEQEQEEI